MKTVVKVLFICFSIACLAQEPYTINYTINDGLPSNNVYSVFQDKDGILWLSTDVGIVSYDSSSFELYNTENGLSDNEIFQIKEDGKGRKWLLTLNGIPSYIQNGQVYNAENSELIRTIKGKSMLINYYEDSNNTLYFSYSKGEMFSVSNSDEVSKFSLDTGNLVGVWVEDNTLMALTNTGIINFENQKTIRPIEPISWLRMFHDDSSIFYSNKHQLYEIRDRNIISKVLEIPEHNEIINYYRDGDNIWICSRNGLYLFDENGHKLRHCFNNTSVSGITKDFEGNYWVSTLDQGLFFVPSFAVNKVDLKLNCITKDKNNTIWLGGRENDYYTIEHGNFVKHSLNSNWRKDDILNIRFQNYKTYILGKVGILEIDKNRTTEYQLNSNDILFKNNSVFLASTSTFKLSTEHFRNKLFREMKPNIILNRRSIVMSETINNDIWIGTNMGLFKYNSRDSIKSYSNNFNGLETSINDIYYDNDEEHLLIASASKGILILEKDSITHTISQKTGLNNNTTNTIEKTAPGDYLIGTNKGLDQIIIQGGGVAIKNYNTSLGFKNKKIYDILSHNDTIYLATEDELVYYKISDLYGKTSVPKCLIETISSKGEDQTIKEQLKFSNNEISVSFKGISFIDQGNVDYYYKLNNYDSKWSQTKETQINYKSLAPGNYTFSVYCVNGFKEKSVTQYINFTILKPFWKKTWFLTIIVLLTAFLIFSLWKQRIKYLNRQFEKERKALFLENENVALENQMLALEQKALRLQMNPHFIFNALNTIKGYYSEG
ncbi:MAG: two-component regulator propeller domain-containing protein, partial [Bacteroidota bacterium]